MKNLFLLSLLFLISSCSTDEVDTSTDLKSNTLTKSINIETSTNSTYKAPSPLTYYVTCTSTSTPPNTYTANIRITSYNVCYTKLLRKALKVSPQRQSLILPSDQHFQCFFS